MTDTLWIRLDTLLAEEMPRLTQIQQRIQNFCAQFKFNEFHLNFAYWLGEEASSSQNEAGQTIHVWRRKGFRLSVSDTEWWLEISAKDASQDKALDALHDFHQSIEVIEPRSKSKLSGSEIARLEREALKAIGDHCLDLPRMSDADLIKFVDDFTSHRIFTDKHIPSPQDVGMCFMVLLFLETPKVVSDAVNAVLPEPVGERPTAPVKPAPTVVAGLVLPAEPPAPEIVNTHQEILEDLQRKVSWGYAPQSELDELVALQGTVSIKAKEAHQAALAEWTDTCDRLKTDHQKRVDAALVADEKAMAEFKQAKLDHAPRLEEWERADTRRLIVYQKVQQHYNRVLGLVWEYLSEAGPRSVNGMPIFMSLRFMHIEDWNRARTAILREEERRKNITL